MEVQGSLNTNWLEIMSDCQSEWRNNQSKKGEGKKVLMKK